ncbi:hypothetical protein [Psychromonas sp.]
MSKALSGELLDKGVELVITIRKNMKKKFISLLTRLKPSALAGQL